MAYPFTSGFFVKLETATVEVRNGKLMLFTDAEETIELEVESNNSYATEVIDFIDCIKNDKVSAINPAVDSFNTLRIAIAEKQSADLNKPVAL